MTKEQLAKSVSKIVSATSGEKVDSVTCESGLEGKKAPRLNAMSRPAGSLCGGLWTSPRSMDC